MTGRSTRKFDGKKYGWLRFGKQAVVIAVLVILILRFVIGISFVDGDSMEPTLSDGDITVYLRLGSSYARGDVVSIRMPSGEYYVKRIIAVEGDTVDIRDNTVYLNGEALEESYAKGSPSDAENSVKYPYEVEGDAVFVMGDNREDSMDSRMMGSISCSQIKGTLLFVD